MLPTASTTQGRAYIETTIKTEAADLWKQARNVFISGEKNLLRSQTPRQMGQGVSHTILGTRNGNHTYTPY